MKAGKLVGVAIVGRPVSRYLDNGETLEVNRLCTIGEKMLAVFYMEQQQEQVKHWVIKKL